MKINKAQLNKLLHFTFNTENESQILNDLIKTGHSVEIEADLDNDNDTVWTCRIFYKDKKVAFFRYFDLNIVTKCAALKAAGLNPNKLPWEKIND